MTELIEHFKRLRGNSKTQQVDTYKTKIAVYLYDSLIGWDSDINFPYDSDPSHTFPLTKGSKV